MLENLREDLCKELSKFEGIQYLKVDDLPVGLIQNTLSGTMMTYEVIKKTFDKQYETYNADVVAKELVQYLNDNGSNLVLIYYVIEDDEVITVRFAPFRLNN